MKNIIIEKATLRPVKSTQSSRFITKGSKCAIVYTKKNGKRISFASEVIEEINSPSSVQIAFSNDGIVISENLGTDNSFELRKSGTRSVIYSGKLIKEIKESFNLSFNSRSTISFNKIKYTIIGNYKAALISLTTSAVTTATGQKTDELPSVKHTEAGTAVKSDRRSEQIEDDELDLSDDDLEQTDDDDWDLSDNDLEQTDDDDWDLSDNDLEQTDDDRLDPSDDDLEQTEDDDLDLSDDDLEQIEDDDLDLSDDDLEQTEDGDLDQTSQQENHMPVKRIRQKWIN